MWSWSPELELGASTRTRRQCLFGAVGYLSAFETFVYCPDTFVPNAPTAEMATTAIKATRSAYSTRDAPLSSRLIEVVGVLF